MKKIRIAALLLATALLLCACGAPQGGEETPPAKQEESAVVSIDYPAVFAAQGGTARIRVYGIPDFDYADVTMDHRSNLTCSLVKVVPVQGQGAEEALPPNQQPVDPQVWYELQGRKVLEALVADLNSRRYNKLFLNEDGSISIQPEDGETEPVQESFKSFPEKVYWPRLAQVLDQEGLSATVQDTCIQVSW